MTLTIEQYQRDSVRTAPFNAAPENFIEFQNILGNYAMGCVGEFMEYRETLDKCTIPVSNEEINEIFREVGDVMHYAVNLLTVLEHDVQTEKIGVHDNVNLDKHLGDILEITKKHIYHGHDLNKEALINAIYGVISYIKAAYPSNFGLILQMNIDKLKKRYPEKFTTADSIARVDVK